MLTCFLNALILISSLKANFYVLKVSEALLQVGHKDLQWKSAQRFQQPALIYAWLAAAAAVQKLF